ncbi:MAG: lamin tail domain-containing protein [Phycisphaerales bacterium]
MSTSSRLKSIVVAEVVLWLVGVIAGCPWRGLGGCVAAQAQTLPAIVINELNTDPDVKTEQVEFVELYNAETVAVDLSGWRLDGGVFYTFPDGTKLAAGGYLIVTQSPEQVKAKWMTLMLPANASRVLGPFGGKLDNDSDTITLLDAADETVDEVTYQLGFPWPMVGEPLTGTTPGTGGSMQLVNPAFDNDLGGCWRSALPTPAAANSGILSASLPPQIRQVRHSPKQPTSGEVVTITAKVTDPDGVMRVTLLYQVVAPGAYVALQDAQYNSNWITAQMHDDGLNGDVAADDGVFSVQIPASVQVNRQLVRYKFLALDNGGMAVTVPYADDTQPNFAYFVYDGVPAWKGAVRTGQPVVEYSAETMRSLPVYHLIAKKQDVLDAFYMPGAQKGQYQGSDYPWRGTLVYDGEVYDHIGFRARGGCWRYAMGKNMPKLDLNRGHYFQARDDYGQEYSTKWAKINFSACIQQGDYQHRGEQGMFEAAGFKMFNLMGCPGSKTHWVHFRVIDEAAEVGATQYDGDFWGLYLSLEQMDGRFLDEHGLADGNLYKMDAGSGDAGPGGGALNNQGPTQPVNNSDLVAFVNGYRVRPPETWWRKSVDLTSYYGFRCTVEGIHHGDMEGGKNWFFYHDPETDQWSILPWDLDLTWANNMYGGGEDDFSRNGVFSSSNSALRIEYNNRQREFFDLLYNSDQGYQMLDDLANIIDPPTGGPTFVGADRAMWDYNPIMNSGYVNSIKSRPGLFYQRAATKDFRGMVKIMKDYMVSNNRAFNTYSEDSQAPKTPTVTATGPDGFPANALTFSTSDFSDSQGAGTFAAMKWRIAEVTPGSQAAPPTTGGDDADAETGTALVPDGASWKYFKGLSEPSTTAGAWRQLDFDDSKWLTGRTAIGYGENFIVTNLSDMRGAYSTVYLRTTFDVADLASLTKLTLDTKYDDGVNVWINGKLAYQDNVIAAELPYSATAMDSIEDATFRTYDLGDPKIWLVKGKNVIAIQILNSGLSNSSDLFIDLRLSAESSQGSVVITPIENLTPYQRTPGKYEINPVWESDDLTTFQKDVKIPASVVRPGRTYRVRSRMKDATGRWSHWSAPVQFTAGEPIADGIVADLRITEVMYNPLPSDTLDGDEFEFIELKNAGDETLDLRGVSFTSGVTFEFADSAVTSLGPGAFTLVVRNKAAFESRYGTSLSSRIAGEYQGRLANTGENVALVDYWNGTIAEFEYGDGRGWPVAADGAGYSLVPLDSAVLGEPQGTLNNPANWRASTQSEGSPGGDDPAPTQTLVINEFLANGAGQGDWIELYNPTASAVSLAGWYLSDDPAEPKKFAIAGGSIPARGFKSFDGIQEFGLGWDGDDIVLSYLPGTADDRIVDAVSFKAQEPGVTWGRYPDGGPYWLRMTPSQDAANGSPVAGPMISEIMYHPADPNEEYIELYNPTAQAITLTGGDVTWRLDGAVDYNLPAGASIPAGRCVVIVGFDPVVDASRLAGFGKAYAAKGPTPAVQVFGPWKGNLSNRGERLGLEKSQAGGDPADAKGWVVVDEAIYSDASPWPIGADGSGNSLQRIHADASHSGNDPANWIVASPSAGIAP